jgi:hypothetical protein
MGEVSNSTTDKHECLQPRTMRIKNLKLVLRISGISRLQHCPLNPPHQPQFIFVGKFVFPDAEDTPLGPPQGASYQLIAFLVAGKFFPPECAIIFRLRLMLRATMPETAIHKQCEPHLPENKIRANPHSLSALGRGPG